MRRAGVLIALALCGTAAAERTQPSDWRRIATPADRDRIRNWRSSWMTAVAAAERSSAREVKAEATLLKPDAALPDATIPPGHYRCRVIKLGAQAKGGLDFVTYPPFQCEVRRDAGLTRLTKLTGSQRPDGVLLADTPDRMIFLGSMMLGQERRALDYGADRERDVAGLLERIGPKRWRLVMPAPHWESLLDVVDLVPVGS